MIYLTADWLCLEGSAGVDMETKCVGEEVKGGEMGLKLGLK